MNAAKEFAEKVVKSLLYTAVGVAVLAVVAPGALAAGLNWIVGKLNAGQPAKTA